MESGLRHSITTGNCRISEIRCIFAPEGGTQFLSHESLISRCDRCEPLRSSPIRKPLGDFISL
jgi:hypothetical protein